MCSKSFSPPSQEKAPHSLGCGKSFSGGVCFFFGFFTRKEQHPSAMAWLSHKKKSCIQPSVCRGRCWKTPFTVLCELVLSVTPLDPISHHLQFLLPHVDVPIITGSHLVLPHVKRERGTEAISIKKKCIHRASICPQDSTLIWVEPRASDTTTVKTTAHLPQKSSDVTLPVNHESSRGLTMLVPGLQ